jgi:hypothetical protein
MENAMERGGNASVVARKSRSNSPISQNDEKARTPSAIAMTGVVGSLENYG